MKKLFATILVFSCLSSTLFAQKMHNPVKHMFTLGVLGGINIPKLTDNSDNPLSQGYGSRLGAAFGLTSSYTLNKKFSLRADLLYSSEGGRRDGMQAFNEVASGTYWYANIKNQSILNYLEIPLLAKYSFSTQKAFKFYIDLGPYFGYLLNAKQKISDGTGLVYFDMAGTVPVPNPEVSGQPFPAQALNATNDITGSINRFNMGLTGGGGVSHKLYSGNIFLDIRGAYGLLNIQKYSTDGKSHNGNVCIAIGYSVPL
jgi:hypothetical protein